MAERNAVDAWAQPVLGRTRADLPEVVRLLEKSGTAHLLDHKLSPVQLVSLMDAAGVQTLMLSAWCRPSRWLITNDEVANHCTEFPDRFAGIAAVDYRIRSPRCVNCGGRFANSGSKRFA